MRINISVSEQKPILFDYVTMLNKAGVYDVDGDYDRDAIFVSTGTGKVIVSRGTSLGVYDTKSDGGWASRSFVITDRSIVISN